MVINIAGKKFEKIFSSTFTKMRLQEYDLIAAALKEVIPPQCIGKLQIMEYGCGQGYGFRSLTQLGSLVATDLQMHPHLVLPPEIEFIITDIHCTDFPDSRFDVLVSNQVLEYLDEEKAFAEMKRLGSQDAYYAFAVPTSFWLIVSQSGNILRSIANGIERAKRETSRGYSFPSSCSSNAAARPDKKERSKWIDKFFIFRGHGRKPDFFDCLKSWKIGSWEKLLHNNGFTIVSRTPLLTYASSVFPFIPANRWMAKMGLSSSFLFICQKASTSG